MDDTTASPRQLERLDELVDEHPDYIVVGWIDGPVVRKPNGDYREIRRLGTMRRVGKREASAMNARAWARWTMAVKANGQVAA